MDERLFGVANTLSNGTGYGNGDGTGNGTGDGEGYPGSGKGKGSGYGDGNGNGNGEGYAFGEGKGDGTGYGKGLGDGLGGPDGYGRRGNDNDFLDEFAVPPQHRHAFPATKEGFLFAERFVNAATVQEQESILGILELQRDSHG
jgi:hypothetical protein